MWLSVVIAVTLLAAVVWVLVSIFRGANERDRRGVKGTFWPQTPAGQLGVLVLVVVVIGMIVSMTNW